MCDDPARPLTGPQRRASAETLRAGLALSGLTVADLEQSCLALDGDGPGRQALVEHLGDRDGGLTAHQHDVLAQALNDHFVEDGLDHPVRYSDDLSDTNRTR